MKISLLIHMFSSLEAVAAGDTAPTALVDNVLEIPSWAHGLCDTFTSSNRVGVEEAGVEASANPDNGGSGVQHTAMVEAVCCTPDTCAGLCDVQLFCDWSPAPLHRCKATMDL